MSMPLEIELLVTAWDNVKKNVFDAEGMNIDPETGEVISGEMSEKLGDIVADLDDKVCDLISYYREDNVFAMYADDGDKDIRETAEDL